MLDSIDFNYVFSKFTTVFRGKNVVNPRNDSLITSIDRLNIGGINHIQVIGIAGVFAFFGLDKVFIEEKVEDVIPVGYTGDQYFATGFIYYPYVPLFVPKYCWREEEGWRPWRPDIGEGEE